MRSLLVIRTAGTLLFGLTPAAHAGPLTADFEQAAGRHQRSRETVEQVLAALVKAFPVAGEFDTAVATRDWIPAESVAIRIDFDIDVLPGHESVIAALASMPQDPDAPHLDGGSAVWDLGRTIRIYRLAASHRDVETILITCFGSPATDPAFSGVPLAPGGPNALPATGSGGVADDQRPPLVLLLAGLGLASTLAVTGWTLSHIREVR